MAEWEKEIAELKTDVKYIREDIGIMQKQVRDLNKHTNMGLGGIKVLLIVGAVVGAVSVSYTHLRAHETVLDTVFVSAPLALVITPKTKTKVKTKNNILIIYHPLSSLVSIVLQ